MTRLTRWIVLAALILMPQAWAADDWIVETLQKGEDLGLFSKRVYGTTRRWQEILQWNQDQIKDPNLLHVGMQLKILPKEKLGPIPAPVATATSNKSRDEKVPVAQQPKATKAAPSGGVLKKFNDMEVDR